MENFVETKEDLTQLKVNKCECYPLYNDLQFPFDKLFIDLRANDQYAQKHCVHAFNVPIAGNKNSFSSNDNEYITLKKSLDEILKKQTYMISTIWFYSDNSIDNIENIVYIQLSEIIKNVLLTQPSLVINVLKVDYQTFETKFPFLCDKNVVLGLENDNNETKTDTDLLLDQYLGIMLNINKDNIILYPSNIINDKLFLGNAQHAMNAKVIQDLKITHIVNCTQDMGSPFDGKHNSNSDDENTKKLCVQYLEIPVVDAQNQQIYGYFLKTFRFINNALSDNNNHNVVFVHCMAGVSIINNNNCIFDVKE